jgi:hypothetical protein
MARVQHRCRSQPDYGPPSADDRGQFADGEPSNSQSQRRLVHVQLGHPARAGLHPGCVVDQGSPLRRAAERFQGSATTAARFPIAVLVSSRAVLPSAHASDICLSGVAALLTVVHMAGRLFRPAEERARLGIDSIGCWSCTSSGSSGW